MWHYEDKEIRTTEDMPEWAVGFIYEIEHIPSGKKYIGKKVLQHNKKLPPLKGYKRNRRVVKESDWKTYYGSNEVIKHLIKEGKHEEFRRVILKFVKSKKLLSYFETKYLFIREVLESNDLYFNDNIGGKFFRQDLLND